MNDYLLYDENTAPTESQATLTQVKANYGFIPNLHATMAESPSLVKAYSTISKLFEETSFSDSEKQLILLTISHENTCHYCMAAHSAVAQIKKVPAAIINALRYGYPVPDKKLETLRLFVQSMVANRGRVTNTELESFFDAGYSHTHVFEVLVGIGMKTMSNYTNHITDTPLDTAFQTQAWEKVS